ncbi:hypothetical protein H0H81_012172 [Sphagnurus paluster]|uniref:AB hydrolase-1 domain-containing protein n=1 Tax=Sphagnurus paluster TaxID=117069 RepID=A0A9P7KKB9_9AGAR|nr:hypothetical protein H0H81_012172 [Sphagnurus paluster]
MDSSLYKSVTTRRGLQYSYYSSAPSGDKPVLVFAHGFLVTSYAWRYQVEFFKASGYGLIVPDLLGVGKSDKPTDPVQYRMSLIVQDFLDILDAEKVANAILIGHVW